MRLIKKIVEYNPRVRNLVYSQMLRLCVAPAVKRAGVPVIAITGSNGKSTVTKLLHRVYRHAGYDVGAACTDWVKRNEEVIRRGDHSSGNGVWRALRAGKVDVMIAETARGGILRFGFGFDASQVSVVTNVTVDHLGSAGIESLDQLADVKERVVHRTARGGTAVLNADDPRVSGMGAALPVQRCYFTARGCEDEFDQCVFLRDGAVWYKNENELERIIAEDEIHIRHGGLLPYHTENVMAVVAVVKAMQYLLPVSPETLVEVLRTFGSDVRDLLFRSTALSWKGDYLLLDFCKNEVCFDNTVKVIDRIKDHYDIDHVVGIVTCMGDRRAIDFERTSERVDDQCDLVYAHPPEPRCLAGKSAKEFMDLLTSRISKSKLFQPERGDMASIKAAAKNRCAGRCLFVLFLAEMEYEIDRERLIEESEVLSLSAKTQGVMEAKPAAVVASPC